MARDFDSRMRFGKPLKTMPRGREYLDPRRRGSLEPRRSIEGAIRLRPDTRDKMQHRVAAKINFLFQLEYRTKGMRRRYVDSGLSHRLGKTTQELRGTDNLIEHIAHNTNCATVVAWLLDLANLDEITSSLGLTQKLWFDEGMYRQYKSLEQFERALERKIKKSYGMIQITGTNSHEENPVHHTVFMWWDEGRKEYMFFEKDGAGFGDMSPMGTTHDPFGFTYELEKSRVAIASIKHLEKIRPSVRAQIEEMLKNFSQ